MHDALSFPGRGAPRIVVERVGVAIDRFDAHRPVQKARAPGLAGDVFRRLDGVRCFDRRGAAHER